MSEFEYVIGIHTIVLGLATAKLLTTIADTAKYRGSIRPFWVHTLWCVILQLTIIGWWYAMWRDLSGISEFSYGSFVSLVSVSVAFFLMSSFLSLDVGSERTTDLEEYYSQIRIPMFLSFGYAWGFLVLRSILVGDAGTTGSTILDAMSLAIPPAVVVAGLVFSSRRAHEIIVIVYSVGYLAVEINQLGVGS